MDLQKITLENFKCFQSETGIDFGKLTLLTGANSSGKSSILYSILGAIQSEEFPFQFSTNGKYVNMGDFNEIVYNHNKGKKIKLTYTFVNETVHNIETLWEENPKNKLPQLSELKISSNYLNLLMKYKNKKYTVDFEYNPENDPQNKLKSPDDYIRILTRLPEEIIQPRTIMGLEIDDHPSNQEEKIKLYQIIGNMLNLFRSFDNNLNFISSFRLHPDRGYFETSKKNVKVGSDGKGYLDQIVAWETNEPEKVNELLSILKNLHLLYDIKSKRSNGGKYDLLVKMKEDSIFTSLYDVGFGISQFLPIIVADMQLPNSSTLFVAQPEIHLHPSVQSSFGDYLFSQIKKSDKKYVIETHSEYLLNKIRLGIVKGDINESDVKVLFVDNEGIEAVIHEIRLNKNGQILDAPENFFKTYMIDVMEIAINAADLS